VTFLIDCPNCGRREALEFSYGGETTRRATDSSTEREFTDYLFYRENVNGWQTEWWLHRDGCRAWFLAERHTFTNEIRATYLPGQDRGPHDPAAVTPGVAGEPGAPGAMA
jgi:sarcosine oxidase, subunit delta